jgi:chaperonin GroES
VTSTAPDRPGNTDSPAQTERPRRRVPVRMLHDRLLVLPEVDSAERQTSAGLVIPATATGPKKLAWAKVVATGENVRRVLVGDRVLFDPDERAEIDLEGEDYVLLRERDVHGVFERPSGPERPGLYL